LCFVSGNQCNIYTYYVLYGADKKEGLVLYGADKKEWLVLYGADKKKGLVLYGRWTSLLGETSSTFMEHFCCFIFSRWSFLGLGSKRPVPKFTDPALSASGSVSSRGFRAPAYLDY